jgi:hypothetical protein
MVSSVAVIAAPSAIGISPYEGGEARRLDLAPGSLREREVVKCLATSDLGDFVPPQRYSDLVRPQGQLRNQDDVAGYARELADGLRRLRAMWRFVLRLGGGCSLLLGALLGLRLGDRSPVGLVYSTRTPTSQRSTSHTRALPPACICRSRSDDSRPSSPGGFCAAIAINASRDGVPSRDVTASTARRIESIHR